MEAMCRAGMYLGIMTRDETNGLEDGLQDSALGDQSLRR